MRRLIIYLFYTELLLLWRRSQDWLYPVAFFIVILSLFPFAFETDQTVLKKFMPGYIWIAALLASLLSSQLVFAPEIDDAHLQQWLLCPVPLHLLVSTKLAAEWTVTQLPLVLLTPLLSLGFHLSMPVTVVLTLSLLIGTPILCLLSCFAVSLTLGLRQQGTLLGLLILPLAMPVLIFGINIVKQFEAGLAILGPLTFLIGLMVLSLILLPFVISSLLFNYFNE